MRYSLLLMSSLAVLAVTACSEPSEPDPAENTEATSSSESASETPDQSEAGENVLLAEWDGPYGGVPPFDEMDLQDLNFNAVGRECQRT